MFLQLKNVLERSDEMFEGQRWRAASLQSFTKIGKEDVRYLSYSEKVLYRREGANDIVVFTVKLKVNSPLKIKLLKLVTDTAKILANNAQNAASKAQTDATNAQTAANNTQKDANTANTKLGDIANDNLLTPSEKQDTLKEWEIIKGEYSTVIAQAATYAK